MDQVKEDSLFKELEQREAEELIKNTDIQKLLTTKEKRYKTINIGETAIRIKPGIPKDLRGKIMAMAGKETVDLTDEHYQLMADLCIDAPWNNILTWKVVDQETGESPMILVEMVKAMYQVEMDIKSFRGRR